MNLSTKTYLTRKNLNRIFKKELSDDEVEDLMFEGTIEKKFSYYLPSIKLLRELKMIPDTVRITDNNWIAKKSQFLLKDLMVIFNCNKDTVHLIVDRYFYRRHNYYYKNEKMQEILMEGDEYVSV